MIESNVIEWLDFGDSAQNIDIYSKKRILLLFSFCRALIKNKYFPPAIYAIFLIIFFIQLWTMSIMSVPCEGDAILEILDYLKKVTVFFEIIENSLTYNMIVVIPFYFILFDFILCVIAIIIFKKVNISFLFFVIYFFNSLIFYYFSGPILEIFLYSFWCENGTHVLLNVSCFSNKDHLLSFIFSVVEFLISLSISLLYSFYCNEIGLITTNIRGNMARINCNYELFCLISKLLIFITGFIAKKRNKETLLYKLMNEILIFIISLIMSIYVYKNIYYYNNLINYINFFGWYYTAWFSFCITLKTALKLENVTTLIIIGWIIIGFAFYKAHKIKEYSLITEENIFEFKNNKSIEMYNNIILSKLSEKSEHKSKILLLGIIKKFEEFASNNPEINFHYHKLLNDKTLKKKFNNEDDLPILSIIYILYSFYLEKSKHREEMVYHMCYFLINNLNNPTYAMSLCSKVKNEGHKLLFYKYLLTEDIKEYLIFKLNKNTNRESIKHVQIGSVILYNLYIYLFKIKIYDAICSQIDYFDLLKNAVTTSKTTDNFLKSGEIILKSRREIITIWEKLIELNPFSDDCQKDYILYLDSILQDEILSREENKKYMLLKNSKYQEKNNLYHSMFLMDTSCILLVDGYLSNGKILYSSQNFSFLFLYNSKELLNLSIDDLLPNVIQTFHKELINDAIKYSNINNKFKAPKESLIKNKLGGLYNIKLFVKPVPNLSYGLIYYTYIQKIIDSNFLIILDKDLKINGFTEIGQIGSQFTMDNEFNLTQSIIGYHIGTIIPDILSLLEYKNEEFNIIKKDTELKGYLYPIENYKDIKSKIDIILEKIKANKNNDNNYQGQVEDDPQNILAEFNEIMKELNNQKIKPISIFYKVKLFNFIDGKYKYYKIYINSDMISDNELGAPAKPPADDNDKNNIKGTTLISKKSKDSKKKIIIKINEKKSQKEVNNNINNNENSDVSINGKIDNDAVNKDKKNEGNKNKEQSKNNDNNLNKEKKHLKHINTIEELGAQSNNNINAFNKLKNDIINKRESYPIKLMFLLCFIFVIMTVILMVIDLLEQKSSFNKLSKFLEDNLFFNNTKVISAVLYIIGVNIRWASHSLYKDSVSCIKGDFFEFYRNQLSDIVDFLEVQKNASLYLDDDYKEIFYDKKKIGLYVYKFDETEKYDFNLDNLLTFLINTGIKLIDTYNHFSPNNCGKIPEELGLDEINLKNLIEMSYYVYTSNINGFTGDEKKKKINQNYNNIPILMIIDGAMILIILFFYIHYILSLHNIEIYFLEKLINFNSLNFDNYLTKIDEIKKKLRNDSNEDEDKGDDVDFNEIDSKKKDEENEGKDNNEGKTLTEKDMRKSRNKRRGSKQSKIQQQRKKKLQTMKLYFTKNNILFILKILLIIIVSFLYYVIIQIMKNNYKNGYLTFDTINDSINSAYKESYDIFIPLKRELDFYEQNLINCTTIGNFEKMKFPKIGDITTPKLGNLLLEIQESSDFNEKTMESFELLFNDNTCKLLSDNDEENLICEKFWSGILLRGLEQAIIQMGGIISSVLDELDSLNDVTNQKTLLGLMNESSFIIYEQFMEFYLLKAYRITIYLFTDLRQQKINASIKKLTMFLIIFIIIIAVLFTLFLFFIYDSKNLFNSFLNFICILPSKYISEDDNFYKEIINFGNKYF